MKRILMAFALTGIMIFGGTQTTYAQDDVSAAQQEATTMGADTAGNSATAAAANETVSVKLKVKIRRR